MIRLSSWAASRLAVVIGLVALLAGLGAAPAAGVGPPVTVVEIRADSPIDGEDLADLVVVRPGRPLDPEEVRRTLRNLHAVGLAGAIDALAVPEPSGGVRLVLAMRALVRVASVEIEGELGLRRVHLEAELVQAEAAPLSESRVLRSVYRLQDLYREQGYDRARVRVSVRTTGRQAIVTFRVDAGPRTVVEEIRFAGLPSGLDPAELRGGLRLAVGDGIVESRVEDDVERLEDRLRRAGFRAARVESPRRLPGSTDSSLVLEYPVSPGPRIELSVLGVDKERLRRRGPLEAFYEQPYDEALLLQTERAIRRDYQSRGHYRVSVESRIEEEEEEDRLRITLVVQPGPTFELDSLELAGNQWATDAALAERMETAPRRGLGGGGHLVDAVLEEDLKNLRSFYALEGFPEARIGPAKIEESGGRLRVVVPIEEGRRRQVVTLEYEGLQESGLSLRPGDLPLRPGGPFHPRLLEETVEELRARLEDAGYLSAQVSSAVEWSEDGARAHVLLSMLPGPRAVVDRVIVRGNRRTDGDLVRRALALERGSALSRARLLAAQRRLYQLGIFSRAEVRLAPAPPFAERRDVLVRLEEGSAQRVTYGVGYDSEDGLRGLLGYSHANLGGRGVSARFDLRWSTREQQLRLLARQPYLGRFDVPLTYSLFVIEEEQESFTSKRRGTQVEAERLFNGLRLALLYTFKIVELADADAALQPLEVDRDLQEVEISSLTPSFFVDRRDDPLLPTRGWTLGLQTEYAFELGNADAEFVKLFSQQSLYLPLGRLGVLAGSLRLGALEPHGDRVEDPTLAPGLESARVPISERFFAGGRNSHRAYRRDRLGITGTTILEVPDETDPARSRRVPVGGNGVLLVNLDYRFPIAGPLGGTAFADLGNVWADWRDVDPGELKAGAGVGLRYLSPIGPLRLEVGWKLDREAGEDPAVIFLSFGNPF